MKKILTVTILLIIFIFAGCTGTGTSGFRYNKPGITQQQADRDVYQCRQEATYYGSSAYVGRYGGSSSSGPELNLEMAAACMRAKGYTITNR